MLERGSGSLTLGCHASAWQRNPRASSRRSRTTRWHAECRLRSASTARVGVWRLAFGSSERLVSLSQAGRKALQDFTDRSVGIPAGHSDLAAQLRFGGTRVLVSVASAARASFGRLRPVGAGSTQAAWFRPRGPLRPLRQLRRWRTLRWSRGRRLCVKGADRKVCAQALR